MQRHKPKKQIKEFLAGCTVFQRRVYIVTMSIPKGQARSYKWVAAKTGRPGAYRAVGNALNKNPFPVLIPCHRVIKADGSIGGFSKGPANKRKLLKAEAVNI